MGLDMYLYASKYVSDSELFDKDSPKKYAEIIKAVSAEEFPKGAFGSATVDIQVGYWRKANAIHDWFVQNCQGGEDDCRKSHVSRDTLIELREACATVLAEKGNRDRAEEFLPTAVGFFFGSEEYDEYYYEYLQDTITLINTLLVTVPEDWDFAYQSSW
jgi:hypothetical protein